MLRTHDSTNLRPKLAGRKVALAGWVHRRRDHGGLIFIDLRDRHGITQVVFSPKDKVAFKIAENLRPEYVIFVEGKVNKRPKGAENKELATGGVEVMATKVEILNPAKTPPFEIDQAGDINEELRLQYRYLDLRRERMRDNIVFRHKVVKFMRDFFDKKDFLEIETPILIKNTPEGAREFLVPSRKHPGNFFVLPQSPQQLKQLLMVSGFEKYFQIARCFRDEDQRGDRQPEFTQLDIEMSFVEQEDVLNLAEELVLKLVAKLTPKKKVSKKPIPRLTYAEAMSRFGSDRPDLRFGLELIDFTNWAKKTKSDLLNKAEVVRGLRVSRAELAKKETFTRSEIDELTILVKNYGLGGLAYVTKRDRELISPLMKFIDSKAQATFKDLKNGEIIFFGIGEEGIVNAALGALRNEMALRLKLADANRLSFVWVTDFPLFAKGEGGKLEAEHHPFTAPNPGDLSKLDKRPPEVRALAYDLVLNGSEIAGGSIRIHEPKFQQKIFEVLGLDGKEIGERFGHLLKAFEYGAPPHGGIAFGLDRFMMILRDEETIREVIAFPKNQNAYDPMLETPSPVDGDNLKEAGIGIINKKK